MKKRVVLFVVGVLMGLSSYCRGQEASCCVLPEERGLQLRSFGYSPAGTADWNFEGNRVVRVAFHFLSDKNSSVPLNFGSTSSGEQINGYEYSERIISIMNNNYLNNRKMNLPVGNDTPVLPIRLQCVLSGIYFYDVSERSSNNVMYEQNAGEVINVYFEPSYKADTTLVGSANMAGEYRSVTIRSVYNRYLSDSIKEKEGEPVWGIYVASWLVAHEIGHSLGLHHTLLTPSGLPDKKNEYDDYCSDTPTYGETVQACGTSRVHYWNPDDGDCCTNNMMDYAGCIVLTPEQINRIHYGFQTETKSYMNSSFRNASAAIRDEAPHNAVIAKKVNLERERTITVSEGESLVVNAEEVNLFGSLSVEKGGVFIVQTSKGGFL